MMNLSHDDGSQLIPISMELMKSQNKLQKMTKILMGEEQKTLNRIKLYNKTTSKIFEEKRKEIEESRKSGSRFMHKPRLTEVLQMKIKNSILRVESAPKLRNFKSEGSIRSNLEIKTITSSRTKEASNLAESRRVSKKVNQELIEKNRKAELRKKLKSANLIKSSRENIKSAKEKYFNWKINSVKEMNQQKWHRNYNEFQTKQKEVEKLKKLEYMALLEWKRSKEAFDNPSKTLQEIFA